MATRRDFDSPWKTLLERQLEACLAFYFPALYSAIDWSVPPKFLDQEFQKIMGDNVAKNRRVDKLVDVRLKSGESLWLLIHIEVQNEPDEAFEERIFIYYYRIYDKYERYPVSVAILTDGDPNWTPRQHRHAQFDCTLTLDFPTVKLLNYDRNELMTSTNPFALVTLAHLETLAAGRSDGRRMTTKFDLIKRLLKSGYDKQAIRDLFHFIDWILLLPPELEQKLQREVTTFTQENRMEYLSSWELKAFDRGIEQGEIKGRIDVILKMLRRRFGALSSSIEERVKQIDDPEKLDEIGENLMEAESLADLGLDEQDE